MLGVKQKHWGQQRVFVVSAQGDEPKEDGREAAAALEAAICCLKRGGGGALQWLAASATRRTRTLHSRRNVGRNKPFEYLRGPWGLCTAPSPPARDATAREHQRAAAPF